MKWEIKVPIEKEVVIYDPVIYHVNLSKAYKMYYNKDRKLNTFIKELALMIANNKEDLNKISKGDKVMEGAINKIASLSMDDYIKGYYNKNNWFN